MARDPGLRKPIWMYDVNQQDKARRAYIDMGPCQHKLDEYEKIWDGNQFCRFQYPWFAQFSWLEYSIAKNIAFCFPCFIFDRNSSKFKVFTVDGFDNWKRVNNGKLCKFKHHERDYNSLHKLNVQKWDNLKCPSRQIDQVMNAQSSQQVVENRLRLKTSIETVKWLAKQACAFRGHDESSALSNRGNLMR